MKVNDLSKLLAILVIVMLSACASHSPQPPPLRNNARVPINSCLLPNATAPCEISMQTKENNNEKMV